MRKTMTMLLCLLALEGPGAQAKRRAPLMISPQECSQHHLTPLELVMPWNTGVAELNKFPGEGIYVQNQPTPPGGAYEFRIAGYEGLPAGHEGLIQFLKPQYPRAEFVSAPDWVSPQGQKFPACMFSQGRSHAHTAYVAVQLCSNSKATSGAVMIHGTGPWPDKPLDFQKLTGAFARLQLQLQD